MGDHVNVYNAGEHSDAGRLFEIDISSGSILRSCVVGTMPEIIYYYESEDGDKILVSVTENFPSDQNDWTSYSPLDIVDVRSFTRIQNNILCVVPGRVYQNDLFNWPATPDLVGMSHQPVGINQYLPGAEDAIWLIDPITATCCPENTGHNS